MVTKRIKKDLWDTPLRLVDQQPEWFPHRMSPPVST